MPGQSTYSVWGLSWQSNWMTEIYAVKEKHEDHIIKCVVLPTKQDTSGVKGRMMDKVTRYIQWPRKDAHICSARQLLLSHPSKVQ